MIRASLLLTSTEIRRLVRKSSSGPTASSDTGQMPRFLAAQAALLMLMIAGKCREIQGGESGRGHRARSPNPRGTQPPKRQAAPPQMQAAAAKRTRVTCSVRNMGAARVGVQQWALWVTWVPRRSLRTWRLELYSDHLP